MSPRVGAPARGLRTLALRHPSRRERLFNLPPVIVAVVAVLVAIQAGVEWGLSDPLYDWVLAHFAFVPAQFTQVFDPAGVRQMLVSGTAQQIAERAVLAHVFLGDGRPAFWTPLTYGLLHGNWSHVGLNCLWLVAFGTPVAVRFGAWRFLGFLVVTSVAGAALHFALHRFDVAPVIGASAAVSGAVAGAVRFAFEPGVFLAQRLRRPPADVYRQPALSLRQVFARPRTLWFLGLWQVLNVGAGLFAQPLGLTDSPIAWEAHIGGLVAGLVLFAWFDPVRFTDADLPPFVPELPDDPSRTASP